MKNTTKPIRIAQIMGKLCAGGVESVAFNYYRAIDKSRYQFDFYYDADSTVEPPQDLIEMGARFIKIPPYQKLNEYLKILKKYLKDNNYQIVHSHLNTLSVFPLYAARCAGVPIRIAHNHSVPGGNEVYRNLAKNTLKYFSKVNATDYFACSEKAGRWLFGDKDYNSGKVFVMKNAIDFSQYNRPVQETIEITQKLNLENKFVVGHVGRFTFAKNHKFVIEVFNEILKKRANAVLLLVGDGELHKEIVDQVHSLNLDSHVVMTGKVSDPQKYYAVMDVLILPSVFEGLSMTTIEAQAAGKNILISQAVPKEAVISDGCHYMDEGSSVTDWAVTAINVADKKIEYDHHKADYDISNAVKKLEQKYDQLLKRAKEEYES